MLPRCNASSQGGGTLPIPFTLPSGRYHYNFYRMISLISEGAIISLDGVLGVQLGINMLRRKYSTETIHYIDLVSDYMSLP